MPRYVLGVDGGGTKTLVAIMAENGRFCATGTGGPSNVDDVGLAVAQADNGEELVDYQISQEPLLPFFLEDYKAGQFEFRSTSYFELSDIWTRALTRVLEGEDVKTVLLEAQIAAEFAVEE